MNAQTAELIAKAESIHPELTPKGQILEELTQIPFTDLREILLLKAAQAVENDRNDPIYWMADAFLLGVQVGVTINAKPKS